MRHEEVRERAEVSGGERSGRGGGSGERVLRLLAGWVGGSESGRARVDRSHLQCTINTACHKRTMPRAHILLISLSVTPRFALCNVPRKNQLQRE